MTKSGAFAVMCCMVSGVTTLAMCAVLFKFADGYKPVLDDIQKLGITTLITSLAFVGMTTIVVSMIGLYMISGNDEYDEG